MNLFCSKARLKGPKWNFAMRRALLKKVLANFWKRLVLDQAYKHATVISPADTDRHACIGVSNLWNGL